MSESTPGRLVLATTVWKRPELTEIVLGYYDRIRSIISERVHLTLLAVGSEGHESRDLCERNGFSYIETANEPVTYKWNAVVREARAFGPEGIILVNSDDVVSSNLFEVYLERLSNGVDFFGLRDAYIFNVITGILGRWPGYDFSHMKYRVGEPAGCARCFSRRLLEETGWRLWPSEPPRNSKMDFWCTQFVGLFGFEPEAHTMEQLGVEAVQLKTDVNITPFDSIPLRNVKAGDAAWQDLRRTFEEWEIDDLLSLHQGFSPRQRGGSGGLPDRDPGAGRRDVYTLEEIMPMSRRDQMLSDLEKMRRTVEEERRHGNSSGGVACVKPI